MNILGSWILWVWFWRFPNNTKARIPQFPQEEWQNNAMLVVIVSVHSRLLAHVTLALSRFRVSIRQSSSNCWPLRRRRTDLASPTEDPWCDPPVANWSHRSPTRLPTSHGESGATLKDQGGVSQDLPPARRCRDMNWMDDLDSFWRSLSSKVRDNQQHHMPMSGA